MRQAECAGSWLTKQYPTGFDLVYVSDHVRAKETALHTCRAAHWHQQGIRIDPLVGERNWGDFNTASAEQRAAIMARRKTDPLHATMPNGETLLATRDRSRNLLERVARECPGKSVLVFTHGEFIEALWGEIAHWSTEEQSTYFSGHGRGIPNCQVVEFSSIDPERAEPSPHLRWVRRSTPHLGDDGRWEQIHRTTYLAHELEAQILKYPRFELPY